MTPEEKFSKDVSYVLKEIKERLLYTKNNVPVEYVVVFHGNESSNGNTPSSPDNEDMVIHKLEESGIFEILDRHELPNEYTTEAVIFKLKIHKHNFDKIYTNYFHDKSLEKSNMTTDSNLSEANKKKLFILEKLKDEWDLAPKYTATSAHGARVYRRPAGEVNIPWSRFNTWMRECKIDYYQLENILATFQQEGLLKHFSNHNEYE